MKILWLKLDIDIFDNAKIKKIRRMAGGDQYFVLWVGLLTLGMKCRNYGILEISDGIPYAPEDLADNFSMTVETVKEGLNIFSKFNMIHLINGNTIEICDYRKHQNIERIEQVRELARLRQEKRREKIKIQHNKLIEFKAEEEAEAEEEESLRESRVTNVKVKQSFIKPTLEQITQYIQEKQYTINAEKFLAYYESNGWMVGRNKMKSWAAALKTWQYSDFNKQQQPAQQKKQKSIKELLDEESEKMKKDVNYGKLSNLQ
jgi:predicted phage replisome organizer